MTEGISLFRGFPLVPESIAGKNSLIAFKFVIKPCVHNPNINSYMSGHYIIGGSDRFELKLNFFKMS